MDDCLRFLSTGDLLLDRLLETDLDGDLCLLDRVFLSGVLTLDLDLDLLGDLVLFLLLRFFSLISCLACAFFLSFLLDLLSLDLGSDLLRLLLLLLLDLVLLLLRCLCFLFDLDSLSGGGSDLDLDLLLLTLCTRLTLFLLLISGDLLLLLEGLVWCFLFLFLIMTALGGDLVLDLLLDTFLL